MRKQSPGDCASLCMELSLLFAAGLGFASAFDLLAKKSEDRAVAARMKRAQASLAAGGTLSSVLAEEELLPREGTDLLAVAEETGRVEAALRSLSQYYRRREESARALRAAITYPAVLTVVMVAVVLVLLTKVLPVFSDIYDSLGGEMGAFARTLCVVGVGVERAMPVLLTVLAVLSATVLLCVAVKPWRVWVARMITKLFSRTKVSRAQASARFADALSMALCSGFTPAQAAESAAQTLVGTGLAAAARRATEKIAAGEEPIEALRLCGLLPPDESKLLTIGIVGGAVETAAEECARRAYNRADDRLERVISAIEPVIVVVTSLLVGVILLSVLFPLTEILSAIG